MIGRTLLHYQITERLGEGGMGVVYKARDTHLERFVAIKVLPPEKVADPERKRRFVQEARAASALNHPNIVTIHDIDEAGGVHFIAMEYVAGKTLDELIPQKGMRQSELLKIAAQIAGALARAHSAGIVHRDLKPANVMVDTHGLVKVLDFGLAKLAETQPPDGEATTRTLRPRTAEGQIMGTVAYMSPEQAQGLPVDARSDVFSFGCLLFEMATGRRAFYGETAVSTLAAIIKEEPSPAAEIPPDLGKIISRCLRKDPDRRFQHVEDLKVALEEMREESKPAQPAPPAPAKKRLSRRRFAAGVLGVAAVAAAAGLYFRQRGAPGPAPEGRAVAATPSIAVLPFANLSGDKDNEYFSDGLAEEVINALTALPGLRVVARTSAFAFRGREQDIREIGAKLNVTHVLEGSVRRAGNQIRVTAQLINVADGFHVWSERYDREMTGVFAIQDAICRSIVERLKVRLAPGRALVRRPTENVKAYQLVLNGSYHMSKYTPDALAKARAYFEQAIAEDPEYPLARYALGTYFTHMAHFGFEPPRQALASAREQALKALERDGELALAHGLLGFVSGMNHDWAGAEKGFRRALELDRQTIEIWPAYDYVGLVPMRRLDEALAASQRALELDPLSPFARWRLAYRYYVRRQYDLAVRHCRSALELDANYLAANDFLGLSLLFQGKPDEGIPPLEKSVTFSRRAPFTLGNLGFGLAMAGRMAEARSLLAELEQMASKVPVPPSAFGKIYLGLGELERAFDWFEKAVDERDGLVLHLHIDPSFDRLRTHPRYRPLLRRMNLEP